MKEIFTPFKVGLLVLSGLFSSVWMFGKVREGIGDDPAGYRVHAIFRDVSGLAKKSRVSIAGITIGQIHEIDLVGDKAKVTMLVNTPLRSDAQVTKRSASLLGEFYLELTPGYTGIPLKDGDALDNVHEDAQAADLMNEMKTIAEDVREITASLKRVVSDKDGEQKLSSILDNINKTVAALNRAVGENGGKVDQVIDNIVTVSKDARLFLKEFRYGARKLMKDAQVVASGAREIVVNVQGIIGDNKGDVKESVDGLKGAFARVNGALDKLDGTLESTRSIAQKIDEGKGSIGRLVNDDRLVNNTNELLEEAGGFVKQLTRLQTRVALRSEYYISQGSLKNYLSLKLQPRPDKYYMIQLVDDPRGNTIFKETVTRSSDSSEDPVIREHQSITEDSFRLSLEFAKRFFFATGRVGIIEGTGGVGLDLNFLDDNLQFSTDIFAFQENVNPRIKFGAHYTFFNHIFVAGGVDEVWNDELSDYFLGAGISFNDEDLKAILTTAPSF